MTNKDDLRKLREVADQHARDSIIFAFVLFGPVVTIGLFALVSALAGTDQ